MFKNLLPADAVPARTRSFRNGSLQAADYILDRFSHAGIEVETVATVYDPPGQADDRMTCQVAATETPFGLDVTLGSSKRSPLVSIGDNSGHVYGRFRDLPAAVHWLKEQAISMIDRDSRFRGQTLAELAARPASGRP
jgi:hypothetical protein